MSVLSFPRVYFRGFIGWDPATGNNNDYFPTYDDVESALNWDFLEKHTPVNRQNFPQTFVPWAIREQTITYEVPTLGGGSASTGPVTGIPAEWNFYGGNAASFVDYQDKQSLVTGGALGPGETVNTDPLIGKPVAVVGNPFGNPDAPTPGRLVDGNPVSVYTSQVYFQELRLGDQTTGIVGQRSYRMQSRFINFTRNFNLTAAGGASVSWQTCFPAGEGLTITAGGSRLLQALEAALGQEGVLGLMVRFNSYLNLYNQNGYFNGISPSPANKNEDLSYYYQQVQNGEIDQFSNPCYSRVVGVIGLWLDDELATVPNGRYLVPGVYAAPATHEASGGSAADEASRKRFFALTDREVEAAGGQPSDAVPKAEAAGAGIRIPPTQTKQAAQLGAALVEVDYARSLLHLDLLNSFPEWSWQGEKVDLDTVEIGVDDGAGGYAKVADLPFGSYDRAAYEAGGGLVDLPFDDQLADRIRNGTLVLKLADAVPTFEPDANGNLVASKDKTVLAEVPLTAQSDARSTYLDQNGSQAVPIGLRFKGAAAAGAKVLVVRYNPPDALFGFGPGGSQGSGAAIAVGDPQVVTIANGDKKTLTLAIPGSTETIETEVNVVTADAQGNLTLEAVAASPGFPILGLFPFTGDDEPTPPAAYENVGTGFFATLRVLPFDDGLVDQFVDLWNGYYQQPDAPEIAWKFVYDEILSVYDQLFPVMRRFLPLNDRARVEAGIDQVLALISDQYFYESTLAMPITRDLSAGKRKVLELWGSLVRRKYPQVPISAD